MSRGLLPVLVVATVALTGCFDFDKILATDDGGVVDGGLACGAPLRARGTWTLEDITSIAPGGWLYTFVGGGPLVVAGSGSQGAFRSSTGWRSLAIPGGDHGAFVGGVRDSNTHVVLAFDSLNRGDVRAVAGTQSSAASYDFTFAGLSGPDMVLPLGDGTVGVAGEALAADMVRFFVATSSTTAVSDPVSGSWTLANPSKPAAVRAIDGAPGDAVLCGYGFVDRWDDALGSWTASKLSQTLAGTTGYTCAAIADTRVGISPNRYRIWVALADGSVCVHEDSAPDWTCVASGFAGTQLAHLAVSGCDPNVAVVTGPNPGEIAISTDAGASWQPEQDTGITDALGAVYIDITGTVFAAAQHARRIWVRRPAP
jgi:hypothetical protein